MFRIRLSFIFDLPINSVPFDLVFEEKSIEFPKVVLLLKKKINKYIFVNH
jgi:hypothetical protein